MPGVAVTDDAAVVADGRGENMEGRVALRAVVRHCRPRVSLEQRIDVPIRLGDLLNDAAKRLVVK